MANDTDALKTAADVRSYFLGHWRKIVPELLVPRVRVGPADIDPDLVQIKLLESSGPVRILLLLPMASGEPRMVRSLLPRLRQLSLPGEIWAGLLVPYMAAAGLRLCREAEVGFLDCCGNSLLRFNEVIVQITGNRNRFAENKRIRTLFHDKATIPLRILLNRPGDWLTTREIAEQGDLSLGWVSTILQSMDAEGYVERKRGGGTRLVEPGKLVHAWLGEYAFEQNEVFPFSSRAGGAREALQRLRTLKPTYADRYALTLQSGLHALTAESSGFDLHVYLPDLNDSTEEAVEVWSDLLDLRPAGMGADCFLVKPTYEHAAFFGLQQGHGLRTVSDLQLYLDLYHYPGGGRLEADRTLIPRLPFTLDEHEPGEGNAANA